ncbi:hypothetical protein CEXT_40711 [Caerostris extrusa]|uniref:Uncharacterized protein n=1 Tax=Caerostris extrusa TaxID=172846 RepID=A0AAV4VXT5_CAEEX|nr:hypothetical protein CEXT_40711 [Caerostris extrusa]
MWSKEESSAPWRGDVLSCETSDRLTYKHRFITWAVARTEMHLRSSTERTNTSREPEARVFSWKGAHAICRLSYLSQWVG